MIALFRELGADKRLKTLMEGESLFNGGVAVVVFLLLVGIPLGTAEFELSTTIARLFTFVGIGIGMLLNFRCKDRSDLTEQVFDLYEETL